MTTAQKTQIKPGIVADRNGEQYWFSGSALVPTRYDKNPIWGSGFTHDSQLFDQVAPFTQISVLSAVPARKTPTILHSPVNKVSKRKSGFMGKMKTRSFSGMNMLTAKPLVTSILLSIVLSIAITAAQHFVL